MQLYVLTSAEVFEIGIQLRLQSNIQFHEVFTKHHLCLIPKYTHRLHLLTYSVLIN